jgi:hypothetical protein
LAEVGLVVAAVAATGAADSVEEGWVVAMEACQVGQCNRMVSPSQTQEAAARQITKHGTYGGGAMKELNVARLQPHEKPDTPVHDSVMLHAGSPEVPPQHELAPLTAHELASE